MILLRILSLSIFCLTPVLSEPFSFNFKGTRAGEAPYTPDQSLHKRTTSDGVGSLPLSNLYIIYEADVSIGSPGQMLKAYVDIGSSDLWVVSRNNAFCNNDSDTTAVNANAGCHAGIFDQNASSTFQFNNSDFYIQYVDLTYAKGIWGTDVVSIGGSSDLTLTGCSLGVALESNTSKGQGILGLGFPQLEATFLGPEAPGYMYENVPQLLASQHNITPVAYSMWLNDLNSQSGELLFGGVDEAKYEGNISTVPMIILNPNFNTPILMSLVLSGLDMVDVNGVTSSVMTGNLGVYLDCGSTYTHLPTNVVDAIRQSIGGQKFGSYILVECGLADVDAALVFNLSGINITVPFSEVVLHDNVFKPNFSDGSPACIFGISADDTNFVLGDTFLRSAYIVYDLDNYEISLAQALYNVSSSNVKAIDSGGIPSAVKAPNFSSTIVQSTVVAAAATGDFSGTRTALPTITTTIDVPVIVTAVVVVGSSAHIEFPIKSISICFSFLFVLMSSLLW